MKKIDSVWKCEREIVRKAQVLSFYIEGNATTKRCRARAVPSLAFILTAMLSPMQNKDNKPPSMSVFP